MLRELEVTKVIIGEQEEKNEQYNIFCNIIKEKQIPVNIVKKGDIINIEQNLKIRILFPLNDMIKDNILNNNSLVFKIEYKQFGMLFTGDIEEIAEEKIINEYNKELKSTILKIAHHGSKTSSTQDFIKNVKPKIAIIGVGANNKFGHPNEGVLERLKNIGTKIYRTDKHGEITIKTNGVKIKETMTFLP